MKKTILLTLSLFLTLCTTACESKTAASEQTMTSTQTVASTQATASEQHQYEIGDVILADGSAVREADLTAINNQNAPIAVIAGFREDGTALGVGVHRSSTPLQWAADGSAGYTAKFTDTVCAQEPDSSFSGDKDGSDNWNAICSRDKDSTADDANNYPAFHFVNTYAAVHGLTGDYASGWYMPSIAELDCIYQNRKAVNTSLKKIYSLDTNAAMDGLETNWYWSSSQAASEDDYAWFIHYFNGYAGECPKNFTNVHALAVRSF